MARSGPPPEGIDESRLSVTEPKTGAAGLPAVLSSLRLAVRQMGAVRTAGPSRG